MSNQVVAAFASHLKESLQQYPVSVERHEGQVRRFFPFHTHDYCEISFTFHGDHYLNVGGNILPYGSGDICLIMPDTLHSVGPLGSDLASQEGDEIWSLRADPSLFRELIPGYRSAAVIPMGNLADLFHNNLELLLQTLTEESVRWSLAMALTTCILETIHMLAETTPDLQTSRDLSDSYLKEIVEYIQENCTDNLTVGTITQRFAISRSNLMRLFQDNLGITPINYRIDCQLIEACALLLKTDRRIEDIAEALGFGNTYYFSSLFRKKMGFSPNHFRHAYAFTMYH